MCKIEIVGAGCEKYFQLVSNVNETVRKNKLNYEIIEITNRKSIAEKGLDNLPGLFINDRLVLKGIVPTIPEMKKLLTI